MHVTGGDAPAPAPARRISTSRWRNPRLVLGVALVLGSAVLGGWLLATARGTTDYWLVRADVRAGDPVQATDLSVVEGRLDGAGSDALIAVAEGRPDGVWARDLAAGMLPSRDAVTTRIDRGRELPLPVEAGSSPPDLSPGERVDVWAGPGDDGAVAGLSARRVLTSVDVLSVSRPDGTGLRTVVVDTGRVGPPGDVVAASRGQLTLVRVP
ncbi:hypothetical protein [Aeromicrobium sp. 179-A 4D2 NHS]|uniref:hypothetical protein n=1 Tax=Aeromicrobium sp. 179-A 4D2 NHS TaxID=3142375 RepID=UPI0039A309B3